MRILLVDDHEIVWGGTRRLLENLAARQALPGEFAFDAARCVADACGRAGDAFDLVLLDYHLPDLSGLAALRAVKAHFEATPVCMQSAETSAQRIREVIEAGAAGFIPKSYRLEEMDAALHVVLQHRISLPAEFVLEEQVSRAQQPDEVAREDLAHFLRTELSPRQRQVLALAIRGTPVKLIARELGIAEGTVKVHLSTARSARATAPMRCAACSTRRRRSRWRRHERCG